MVMEGDKDCSESGQEDCLLVFEEEETSEKDLGTPSFPLSSSSASSSSVHSAHSGEEGGSEDEGSSLWGRALLLIALVYFASTSQHSVGVQVAAQILIAFVMLTVAVRLTWSPPDLLSRASEIGMPSWKDTFLPSGELSSSNVHKPGRQSFWGAIALVALTLTLSYLLTTGKLYLLVNKATDSFQSTSMKPSSSTVPDLYTREKNGLLTHFETSPIKSTPYGQGYLLPGDNISFCGKIPSPNWWGKIKDILKPTQRSYYHQKVKLANKDEALVLKLLDDGLMEVELLIEEESEVAAPQYCPIKSPHIVVWKQNVFPLWRRIGRKAKPLPTPALGYIYSENNMTICRPRVDADFVYRQRSNETLDSQIHSLHCGKILNMFEAKLCNVS